MSLSPVPLKTYRVEGQCTLNLLRLKVLSWRGVEIRRQGCHLRCHPRHLTLVQNYEPPRAAMPAVIRLGMESGFECLLVEESSILLVCAAKVRLLKLQDVDLEPDAEKPNPTRAQ
ncbi:hypothetical protein TNCV_4641271 [Trichonephila clavipes]|nr:hypothetical protein TNCV_4641271 [Trichonephila clavipes]